MKHCFAVCWLALFLFFLPALVAASPSLQITSIPSSIQADESFSINVSLAGLEPNTDYRLKALGKINGTDKLKTLGEDGQGWYPWNGSWNAMPKISADNQGSASASISSKFYEDAAGQAQVFIRTRKDAGGTNYDSASINLNVDPKPSPSPSPLPSPSPSPSTAPSPTPSPAASPFNSLTASTSIIKKKPSPPATLEPVGFLKDNPKPDKLAAEVLGSQSKADITNDASPSARRFGTNALISWLLTGSGILFLGSAGAPFFKQYLFSKSTQNKKATPRTADSSLPPKPTASF